MSIAGPVLGLGIVALVVVGVVGLYGAMAVHRSVTASPYSAPQAPANVVVTPVVPQTNYRYAPPRAYPPSSSTPPGYPSVPVYPPSHVDVHTYPPPPSPPGQVYVEQHHRHW